MTFLIKRYFLVLPLMVCTVGSLAVAQQVKDMAPVKKSEANIRSTVNELKEAPVDSTLVQKEKNRLNTVMKNAEGEVKEAQTSLKKIKEENIDTAKISKEVAYEKQNLKNEAQGYRQDFKVPKFNDIKIDTGEIKLNKQGLSDRGDQFLKTNSSGVKIPESLPRNNFKTVRKPRAYESADNTVSKIKDTKLDEDQLRKQAKEIPGALEGSHNKKVTTTAHAVDSITKLSDHDMFARGKLEMSNVKKVYSEKYLKKAIDSLGLQKADSLYKVAAPLVKKEVTQEELIRNLNQSFSGKTSITGQNYDPTAESLSSADAEKLAAFPDDLAKTDISKMKLPESVMSELEPLRANLVDDKYMKIADSVRDIKLKADRLRLDETQLTETLKTTVIKHRPNFLDKSYIEAIVGYVQTGKLRIFQVSPSWAYHLTDYFSVGLGPSVTLQAEEKKKISAVIGFRCYGKVEFFERRVYLQIEDSMNPSAINNIESVKMNRNNFLAGGGVLLPISKKLALTPCLLYRINTDGGSAGGSQWVFRLGLSAIKTKQ